MHKYDGGTNGGNDLIRFIQNSYKISTESLFIILNMVSQNYYVSRINKKTKIMKDHFICISHCSISLYTSVDTSVDTWVDTLVDTWFDT